MDQPRPRRAHCEAHCGFPCPRRYRREQQITDVRTRDDEYQGAYQKKQQGCGEAIRVGCNAETCLSVNTHLPAAIRGRVFLLELCGNTRNFGPSLLYAHAWFYAPIDFRHPHVPVGEKVRSGIINHFSHHSRYVKFRVKQRVHATKCLRYDTNYRQFLPVHLDGFADDVGASCKVSLPHSVADHCHGIPSRRLIFVRPKVTAHDGLNAHRTEEVTADEEPESHSRACPAVRVDGSS